MAAMKHWEAIRRQKEASSKPIKARGRKYALWMGGCPWRIAVAYRIAFNTSFARARKAILDVLAQWPTPEALAMAKRIEVVEALEGIEMRQQKARMIQALSASWIGKGDGWGNILDLPGLSMSAYKAIRELP